MRHFLETQLSAQLTAEDSLGAVCKILAVLCDAVVHLGPHGEIMKPSPQLYHLLGVPLEVPLVGFKLVDHFASDDDRRRFVQFIHEPTSQDVTAALHVNIRGRPEPVVCFHSHLPSIDGPAGHLICLRETGNSAPPVVLPGAAASRSEGRLAGTPQPRAVSIDEDIEKRAKSVGDSSSASSTSGALSMLNGPELAKLKEVRIVFDIADSAHRIVRTELVPHVLRPSLPSWAESALKFTSLMSSIEHELNYQQAYFSELDGEPDPVELKAKSTWLWPPWSVKPYLRLHSQSMTLEFADEDCVDELAGADTRSVLVMLTLRDIDVTAPKLKAFRTSAKSDRQPSSHSREGQVLGSIGEAQ